MEYQSMRYEVSDHVLTITLNRPDRMNAFNKALAEEVIDALMRGDEDDDIRVIVVTGAGRAFSAGADLSPSESPLNKKTKDTDKPVDTRELAGTIALPIYDLKKPLIAAINGSAVGMGLTITLAMDIRIASENAKFGFVFVRRGFVPEGGSNWFLPRIVGMSKAAEWMLTGRVFGPEEALESGLVSEVVPQEALLPRAYELAREIVENTSPVSVALTRQMLWKCSVMDHPKKVNDIEDAGIQWAKKRGADLEEGIASFLEKRPPKFPLKPSKDMPDFYPWW